MEKSRIYWKESSRNYSNVHTTFNSDEVMIEYLKNNPEEIFDVLELYGSSGKIIRFRFLLDYEDVGKINLPFDYCDFKEI